MPRPNQQTSDSTSQLKISSVEIIDAQDLLNEATDQLEFITHATRALLLDITQRSGIPSGEQIEAIESGFTIILGRITDSLRQASAELDKTKQRLNVPVSGSDHSLR